MRCIHYAVLVLFFVAGSSSAFDLKYEQVNSRDECFGAYDMHGALDNRTLYEQVFQWMHEKNVVDWNYSSEVRSHGAADMQCAAVSYKTLVHMPTIFARLLSTLQLEIQLPIEVQKEVCLSGKAVLESATINAPLVRDLRISGRYEVHDEDVKSTVEAHYELPWYMEILALDVSEHLRTNLKEKTDAVAASLCVRRPGAATLHRAAQRYAEVHGALRRQARKYPMPAPAQKRLHLQVPVERPIHAPFGQRYY